MNRVRTEMNYENSANRVWTGSMQTTELTIGTSGASIESYGCMIKHEVSVSILYYCSQASNDYNLNMIRIVSN